MEIRAEEAEALRVLMAELAQELERRGPAVLILTKGIEFA